MEQLRRMPLVVKLINWFYLAVLNVILMSLIGFLTIDSAANMNSRIGAYLLSALIPYFIVTQTKGKTALERTLKFGFGFMAYIVLALVMVDIPYLLHCGLLPCLLIAIGILYAGNKIIDTFPRRA